MKTRVNKWLSAKCILVIHNTVFFVRLETERQRQREHAGVSK